MPPRAVALVLAACHIEMVGNKILNAGSNNWRRLGVLVLALVILLPCIKANRVVFFGLSPFLPLHRSPHSVRPPSAFFLSVGDHARSLHHTS
ncbi:hypothetical protein OF83DRAFT_1109024 [Amylostereum chailletii]|nr:hypothetical protein OF83DRAFT_1109024 [Amylostereum chailletii]